MEEYQHPLFFQARELTDREKEKIRRHFQKRRCGGGECGMIERVGDNAYKICFKEKEDQERVLQRELHTISLSSGELHLTVSQTYSPQTLKRTDQPSSSRTQTFKKENTKGLEKNLKTDVFLLYYLRDNPQAYEVLQKQLSAINCKVELDFDEEEAVVRGEVEKGPGGAFGSAAERWELQVDKVFISLTERYLCYHVVEPKLVKMLWQDLSFGTDNIKVYTEDGYAVVVGEVQAVKEIVVTLEKRLPIRKELPVVEKQFKLVEKEFSQDMCAHYPEVKILRGNVNLIILEGPDKKVELGVTKLEELMKKIKEKRVKLSTALMTFMASSGVISKYQTHFQHSLRNPVALEVGSDLVLSSLSSDALDEAETAVLRDLSEINVELQGASAVPPDLDQVKEVLIKAKNKENRQELRVDVNFNPVPSGAAMTRVQLVGYNENVNKLREVLQDCQMNQVPEAKTRRIVLLGKTGAGKSSLANTIFGKDVFKVSHTSNSGTKRCQAETRSVDGRKIMLIDTPGLFDTKKSEEKLKPEVVRCITECAPGPHAFLLVLKVERFTEQENDVIRKISEYFSEEAFKYAAVVFTHSEQLPEGINIEEFVQKNKGLSDLMKKCGGRCHVIDNRYWKNNQQNEYRSNQFQVEQLLNTIDNIVMENNGGYTNEFLQTVEREIQQEEERIRLLPEKRSEHRAQEIRAQAQVSVFKKLTVRLTGTATGALLGAFCGVVVMVGAVVIALKNPLVRKVAAGVITVGGAVGGAVDGVIGGAVGGAVDGVIGGAVGGAVDGVIGGAVGGAVDGVVGGAVGGAALRAVAGACAVAGAVKGGLTGYDKAEGAASPWEAAKRAAAAVKDEAQSYLDEANDVSERLSQQSLTQ